MLKKIREIYRYAKANNLKLLSNYSADFWEVYRNNNEYFDRFFAREYKNFYPFGFSDFDEPTLQQATTDFINDVYGVLLFNDKKYAELWRAWTISDEDYSFIDNYNMRETMSKTGTSTGNETKNPHTDSESNTRVYGAKQSSVTKNETTGAQTTETNKTNTTGAQTASDENTVSADNSVAYAPNNKTESETSARIDSETGSTTAGARSDSATETVNDGTHTDTETISRSYGQAITANTGSSSENYTLTRVGNIGVQTGSDMIEKHVSLWEHYGFYKIIFDDIANALLRL